MKRYFQDLSVGKKKRARTRSMLLDSALSVFAKEGIRNTRIEDITQLAGMANATFYNHFKDKSDLVNETVFALAIELNKTIDAEMADIENAAIRCVVATSRFLRISAHEQLWAPVLAEAFYLYPERQIDLGGYLQADVQRGVEQGVFEVMPDEFQLCQIEALIMSSLRLLNDDNLEIIKRTSTNLLQLLGMTPSRARRAVDRAQPILNKLQV